VTVLVVLLLRPVMSFLVVLALLLADAGSNAARYVSIEQARRSCFSPPLGRDTARRLVREGKWRSIRIGASRVLVDLVSVERWAEAESAREAS
jgi:hypothetical protein